MAVIAVREIMDRRRGGVDAQRHRTYERAFRIEFDLATHGVIDCERALWFYYQIQRFCPYIDANGVYDRGALAEAVDCTPEDPEGCFNWIAVVTYSSRLWDDYLKALQSGGTGNSGSKPPSPSQHNNDASSPENPLNRPAQIKYKSVAGRKPLERDVSGIVNPVTGWPDGIAVTNSAGDKFDPPVEVDESYLSITVVRNEANLDIIYPLADGIRKVGYWLDTQNADDFYIGQLLLPEGFVRLINHEVEAVFDDPWSYFRITYEFVTRAKYRDGFLCNPNAAAKRIKPWDVDVLDQGRRELLQAGGYMQNYVDKWGTPGPADVPLNGAGRALTQAQISAGQWSYRAFRAYFPRSYAQLNMPH